MPVLVAYGLQWLHCIPAEYQWLYPRGACWDGNNLNTFPWNCSTFFTFGLYATLLINSIVTGIVITT